MTQIQKNLLSLNENTKNWESMTSQQRVEFTKQVKSKAAIMLLQTKEYLECKNYDKAKQLFIHLGDSLSCIKEPDDQVLEWIELSYSYLANLYRNSQKRLKTIYQKEKKGWHNRQNLLVLKYNKFSGEFQLDEYEQGFVHQDVLQYVSKINAILFGCQNVQNNHSLYVIFTTYWVAFVLTLILIILTLVFLTSKNFFPIGGTDTLEMEIPAMILGGCLIVPQIMIYFKEPEQRDNLFFEKKLGEEIKLINEDCRIREKGMIFMMPHGGQINIRLDYDLQNQDSLIAVDFANTPDDELMKTINGLAKNISQVEDEDKK